MNTSAEILYAGKSAKKKAVLPKEGKRVRESLSEDFLTSTCVWLTANLSSYQSRISLSGWMT